MSLSYSCSAYLLGRMGLNSQRSRGSLLLQIYIFTWFLLLASTIAIGQLRIGDVYFVSAWNLVVRIPRSNVFRFGDPNAATPVFRGYDWTIKEGESWAVIGSTPSLFKVGAQDFLRFTNSNHSTSRFSPDTFVYRLHHHLPLVCFRSFRSLALHGTHTRRYRSCPLSADSMCRQGNFTIILRDMAHCGVTTARRCARACSSFLPTRCCCHRHKRATKITMRC